MKTFSVEEITQIVGGMLTKAQDVQISQIAPPLLSDENTVMTQYCNSFLNFKTGLVAKIYRIIP